MPNLQKHAEAGVLASCNLLNERKLIARDLARMGKIQGTHRISRLIDHRKCNSVITRQAQLAHRRVPLNCLGISWLNLESARSWRRFAISLFHSDPLPIAGR